MKKIGLFYGSDTGYTEAVVDQIKEIVGEEIIDIHDMSDVKEIAPFADYAYIIIGVPTWYDGDLQSDWDFFFEKFQTIDFSNKKVAIFGLGDQSGYPEYFVDGIGTLGNVVAENGGELVGFWSTEGYDFEESKAVFDYDGEEYFMGLAIDEDNEEELTEERLKTWLDLVMEEFNETVSA